MIERQQFCKSKNIRMGRQLLITFLNGSIFMTQFFALKRMSTANFPGFSSEGALWFPNLCACDPYFVLPFISAITVYGVVKVTIIFS